MINKKLTFAVSHGIVAPPGQGVVAPLSTHLAHKLVQLHCLAHVTGQLQLP